MGSPAGFYAVAAEQSAGLPCCTAASLIGGLQSWMRPDAHSSLLQAPHGPSIFVTQHEHHTKVEASISNQWLSMSNVISLHTCSDAYELTNSQAQPDLAGTCGVHWRMILNVAQRTAIKSRAGLDAHTLSAAPAPQRYRQAQARQRWPLHRCAGAAARMQARPAARRMLLQERRRARPAPQPPTQR